MKINSCTVSALIVTLSMSSHGDAAEPIYLPFSSQSTSPIEAAAPIAARSGWRVYIDPITKELRTEFVTAEEATYFHLDVLPAPDYSRMQTEILPDGSQILHTNGEVQSTTVGYVDANGNARETCLTTANPQQRISPIQSEKTP